MEMQRNATAIILMRKMMFLFIPTIDESRDEIIEIEKMTESVEMASTASAELEIVFNWDDNSSASSFEMDTISSLDASDKNES